MGGKMLGSDWTYHQDGARPHTYYLTQKWCEEHFSSFILKSSWPANSPDLCPLDYSLWNELGKAMDWNRITTKATLRDEIKRLIKKIEKQKIVTSVSDFTLRLSLLKKMVETIFVE